MLQQILIKNFALIEELQLPFHEGLTVLSGETGAGKSIVVDAVSVLLGGKADKDMVRSGALKAYVEGTFSLFGNAAAKNFLAQEELDSDDETLTLAREISQSGRSVCRVNGILVNVSILKKLAGFLMEIHGQHEHQALLAEDSHLGFLDEMGDEAYQSALKETGEQFRRFRLARKALDDAARDLEYRQERIERLTHEYNQIEAAHLTDGEEEELSARRDMLRYADKISRALKTVYETLMEGEGGGTDALTLVRRAGDGVRSVSGYSTEYADMEKRLDSLFYEMEDIALTARRQEERLSADGESLEEVESRLDLIHKLEKKYGISIADVLEHFHAVSIEIDRLRGLESAMDNLRVENDAQQQRYFALAKQMTEKRRQLASATEKKIDAELAALNMKGARFLVDMETDRQYADEWGCDRVRFLIAPNKGEEAKALSKTASGGELSRIMLAIKAASAEKTMVPAMVFDEVDTGISGQTATVVAEKMWAIARSHQVICVTHLQQIAAMASSQAQVRKYEKDGRTLTEVIYLDEAGRVREIARLIGETRDASGSGQQHALSMLRDAERFRAQSP